MRKRRFRRAPASLAVEWGGTPECQLAGTLMSLGAGGCFISTEEDVRPGAAVFIRFWLSDRHPQVFRAEARYSQGGRGFGAEFVQVTDRERQELRDFMDFLLVPGEGGGGLDANA